jgi:hypothetical protein
VLDAAVIAALVGVFLLVAGFGGLMVHRLFRSTRRDG